MGAVVIWKIPMVIEKRPSMGTSSLRPRSTYLYGCRVPYSHFLFVLTPTPLVPCFGTVFMRVLLVQDHSSVGVMYRLGSDLLKLSPSAYTVAQELERYKMSVLKVSSHGRVLGPLPDRVISQGRVATHSLWVAILGRRCRVRLAIS